MFVGERVGPLGQRTTCETGSEKRKAPLPVPRPPAASHEPTHSSSASRRAPRPQSAGRTQAARRRPAAAAQSPPHQRIQRPLIIGPTPCDPAPHQRHSGSYTKRVHPIIRGQVHEASGGPRGVPRHRRSRARSVAATATRDPRPPPRSRGGTCGTHPGVGCAPRPARKLPPFCALGLGRLLPRPHPAKLLPALSRAKAPPPA